MKHENVPDAEYETKAHADGGYCTDPKCSHCSDRQAVCNFCDQSYDPEETHTCAGNRILGRKYAKPRRVVEEEGRPADHFYEPLDTVALAKTLHAVAGIPIDPEWRTSVPPEYPERVQGYESLEVVLYEAYQQAATGKGAARHGRGVSFDAQPTQTISELLGTDGGLAFQAMKKINEGMRLDPAAKKKELLGAINYIASIIIFMNQEKT